MDTEQNLKISAEAELASALVRRSGLPRRSDGPWVLTKPVKFLEPRKILGGI
jgi:hypothetical protein